MQEWRRLIETFQNTGDQALEKRAHKMADCCYRGGLYLSADDPPDVRVWTFRCMDRLCPLCSGLRSQKVRNDLRNILTVCKPARHIVLTLCGIRGRPLKATIEKLMVSFRKLRRVEKWKAKVAGGAYVIEVTRNQQLETWHAHLHLIVKGLYFPQKLLMGLWFEITGDSKNVWITPAYEQHAGRLSAYCAKPTDLHKWTLPEVAEYATATQGLRMVQTFGTLHSLKLKDADSPCDLSKYTHFISFHDLRNKVSHGNPVCRLILGYICDRYVQLRGLAHGLLDLPPPDKPGIPRDDAEAWKEALGYPGRFLRRYCQRVPGRGEDDSSQSLTATQSPPTKKVAPALLFATQAHR